MLKFQDIINKKSILKIQTWINDIRNPSSSNVLIIKGGIGSGKTSLCNLIKQEFKDRYQFSTFDIDYMNDKILILDLVRHKNILSLFNNKSISNGIIFDNLKNTSNFIKQMVKHKKEYYSTPIIIVIGNDFNLNLCKFKYHLIEVKYKSVTQLSKIYKNYKINKKIMNSVFRKSMGDFNYINQTLCFIQLSPDITYDNINCLSKDVNLDNYFLLLKFLNSKTIEIEDYDYNFIVFLYQNIFNIINLIQDFKEKKKMIIFMYNYVDFIYNFDELNLNKIMLLGVKYILNERGINIKSIDTVPKSLLLNNNIKSINENRCKKCNLRNNDYLHNIISENENNQYDDFQKFINFVYI